MDLTLDQFIDKPTVRPQNMSSILNSPTKRRLANKKKKTHLKIIRQISEMK
jgi:hypothetical protein